MKLYYFNPNEYGQEFIVMAETKALAYEALLTRFKHEIEAEQNSSFYAEELKVWESIVLEDPSTYPRVYTIDEFNAGQVIITEVA